MNARGYRPVLDWDAVPWELVPVEVVPEPFVPRFFPPAANANPEENKTIKTAATNFFMLSSPPLTSYGCLLIQLRQTATMQPATS
jgi:hypothetical protein